ncbi:MAG: hypothetical protein KDA22_00505 [Phycisphaerales bacterium]|nr:hypothetical protein [Phycisphaerales bacterium]
MGLIGVVVFAAVFLLAAYRLYGRLLARLFRLDPTAPTPSETMEDGLDYVPTPPKYLLGQHFSAIAAAGPIVGPILAGAMFGWLPALVWILVGSVFIGGVHDLGSLVASIRHRARSIAEVVKEHMSRRSYVLFLLFVYIALVYIIVAFTDIVAGSFVGSQVLEDGTRVTGGGIATSSLLYLALPVAMALLMRYAKLGLGWATAIFVPLVGVAIAAGQWIPFDLGAILGLSDIQATKLWGAILLGYCVIAAVVPVWLLLQPRGHLGGWFLYAALASGILGIVIGGATGTATIAYPAFRGFTSESGQSLVPILFITIACGACSGFHCLIASGTTSKQLRRETDAKAIGYGSMLLEAMVATISLACLMMLPLDAAKGLQPNSIYAAGIGRFLAMVGIPMAVAVSFGLLAFTTFVYDTLDVCTRLGRYIIQELTGITGPTGRWGGTILTAGLPLFFLLTTPLDAQGRPVPAWKTFWALFGASNQLLAALALVGITVWLWRTRRAWWVWPVVGLPTLLMYVMSAWALGGFVVDGFAPFARSLAVGDLPRSPVPWVAVVLLALAALLLIEAIVVFAGRKDDAPGATGSEGATAFQAV